MMNPEQFAQLLAQQQYPLTPQQQQQFQTYFHELVAVNEQVNLTRITVETEVYLKHFYDSLTPLLAFKALFEGHKTLCDVGSGAGFPSLPLKLLQPQLKVTIVDSLGKRLKFLQGLIDQLGLQDVNLCHGRAEDLGQSAALRGQFDLVTGRAVAKMPVLSEYCLPLTKVGGTFLALKGPNLELELQSSARAIEVLGGRLMQVKALTLPDSDEKRTLVVIKKIRSTPKKYPRQAGTPGRQPL